MTKIIEDAVDERRSIMKESMCMATLALISSKKEAIAYFKNAREVLASGAAHELMEEEYVSTVVLEALYLSERNILKNKDRELAISEIRKLNNLSIKDKETFVDIIHNL